MMMKMRTFHRSTLWSGASAIGLLAFAPQGALAQSAPVTASQDTPEPSPAPAGPDVVVTASRAGGTGFRAPTPTTVVGAAAIEQKQATNIADVLLQIPAFKPSISPNANGVRTQLPGANLADLRGLGSNRTLVLVDGARVVPQAPANNTGTGVSPDLNQIPALMVDRVEVITGGASAQWGSDAVGGVVNVLLRKKYNGLQVTAQTGFSTYGDDLTRRIGAVGGADLLDDHLHVVAAIDYAQSDKVGDIYTRPWGAQEYQIVANSAAATNGLPVNLIVPNVHFYSSPNLLITGPTGSPYRNFEFGPNGGPLTPFQTGSIVSGTAMIGGQGYSQAKGLSLVPGIRRIDPYIRLQYDVGPNTHLYLTGSYSTLRTNLNPLPSRITGGTIKGDNAYLLTLYPSIAATLGPNGSFTFNRVNYDFNPGSNGLVVVTNKTPKLSFGGEGGFGGTWKWDFHVGWGRNVYVNNTYNNGNKAHETFATDAVLSGGQIVCRALVPGSATYNPTAAAGCVPINLFGSGSPSPAAIAYVTGVATSRSVYEQTAAAANVHGEPFSTWAAPVSVAFGVEYRREKQDVTADAVSAAGGYEIANAGPFSGSFNVTEGYVESIVPLLRDSSLGKSLDLNGAVRVAKYSTVGTQTTWKVGATYEPIGGLRFRGTRSLDIRAPALFELFSPGSIANNSVSVRNPANGNTYNANIPVNLSIGNPNLAAERATTWTLGAVLEPHFLPAFKLSVDYYDINVKKAITTLPATSIASLCNAGDAYYCSAFTFSAAGPPTALALGAQNLAGVHVQGFDAAMSYHLPLSGISSLDLALNGTYTRHVMVDTGTGAAPIDRVGENSALNSYATPRVRANGSLTYRLKGFSLTSELNFISAGTVDNTFNTSASTTANLNHVPAYTYLNIYADMQINKTLGFFAGVRNVFNTAPPPLPSSTLNVVTNGQYYDTIGTFYQVGVRVKL